MYVCRKVKNSQARTGHQRGMGGRGTDDHDTLESDTHRHKQAHKTKKERKKQAHKTMKERNKTDNPREGWEDGTPPPHRDFKERSVVR